MVFFNFRKNVFFYLVIIIESVFIALSYSFIEKRWPDNHIIIWIITFILANLIGCVILKLCNVKFKK